MIFISSSILIIIRCDDNGYTLDYLCTVSKHQQDRKQLEDAKQSTISIKDEDSEEAEQDQILDDNDNDNEEAGGEVEELEDVIMLTTTNDRKKQNKSKNEKKKADKSTKQVENKPNKRKSVTAN